MALSRINKDHVNAIISTTNLEELEKNKLLEAVQSNSNNYAKLKVLFKQMEFIKNEIDSLVNESIETNYLQNVECRFKKIPGKYYYLYKNSDGKLFFSILSNKEWTTNNEYVGKYFYDFDLNFQKI